MAAGESGVVKKLVCGEWKKVEIDAVPFRITLRANPIHPER